MRQVHRGALKNNPNTNQRMGRPNNMPGPLGELARRMGANTTVCDVVGRGHSRIYMWNKGQRPRIDKIKKINALAFEYGLPNIFCERCRDFMEGKDHSTCTLKPRRGAKTSPKQDIPAVEDLREAA